MRRVRRPLPPTPPAIAALEGAVLGSGGSQGLVRELESQIRVGRGASEKLDGEWMVGEVAEEAEEGEREEGLIDILFMEDVGLWGAGRAIESADMLCIEAEEEVDINDDGMWRTGWKVRGLTLGPDAFRIGELPSCVCPS